MTKKCFPFVLTLEEHISSLFAIIIYNYSLRFKARNSPLNWLYGKTVNYLGIVLAGGSGMRHSLLDHGQDQLYLDIP